MNSVCMATYNGERYIQRQLKSILKQLDSMDEVIIFDDCSTDKTREVIKAIGDNRIHLHKNMKNLGVNKTFENALKKAKGDIIFLADQDDIWLDNKVEFITNYFYKHSDVDVVQHDAEVVYEDLTVIDKSFFHWRGHVGPSIIRNLLRDTHLGCCMAMRKDVVSDCLPITSIPYHDKWIGVIAPLTGHRVMFISTVLMKYIRHVGTSTDPMFHRRSWKKIFQDRFWYPIEICKFFLLKRFSVQNDKNNEEKYE